MARMDEGGRIRSPQPFFSASTKAFAKRWRSAAASRRRPSSLVPGPWSQNMGYGEFQYPIANKEYPISKIDPWLFRAWCWVLIVDRNQRLAVL